MKLYSNQKENNKKGKNYNMKTFKKLAALLIAVVMTFGMGTMSVSADGPTPATDKTKETDGSVEVTNAKQGQTYTLYKLFDADMGANDSITYTTTIDLTGNKWFELNSNGYVVAKAGTEADWAKDPEAIAWVKENGTQVGSPITAGTVKWENLAYGYYFVDTTLGSFVGVDSANKNAQIQEKNEEPKLDKEITGVANNDTSSLGTGDETTDPGQGANEKAIAQVGDPVAYKLTVTAKPGAENYVVTDTLSEGLTAPAATGVTVACTDPAITADDYTVAVAGQVITVTFKKAYLDKITKDASIVITYTAVLNDKAKIGEEGNPNTAKLTWGHSPDDDINFSQDDAKVYTAQVDILKTDNSTPAKPLKDAGFVIKNAQGKYYKLDNGVVTWVDSIDAADVHTSGADGKVPAFTGLKNGTYTLVEKVVPEGYNKLDDTDFTIADKDYTNTNLKQSKTVQNQAGQELPSTGGIGTTMFYLVGGALILGAGVVLAARKKAQN